VIRWEHVALRLARDAGIRTPHSVLHLVDGKRVLMIDRFDRSDSRRLGYVSAMTMLEATDADDGTYLDIAEVVEEHSPAASADLRELWRRVAFSILIRNTDDHLRNHGFLRESTAGWALSPAFDLNPDPRPGPKYLTTAIDYATAEARIDVLFDVAEMFRLRDREAGAILSEVTGATARWRDVAADAGLDAVATDRMARAFEHEEIERARQLVASAA
jgi:serine/threonine-protein kinase HipA